MLLSNESEYWRKQVSLKCLLSVCKKRNKKYKKAKNFKHISNNNKYSYRKTSFTILIFKKKFMNIYIKTLLSSTRMPNNLLLLPVSQPFSLPSFLPTYLTNYLPTNERDGDAVN